jgi:hypothetical protein
MLLDFFKQQIQTFYNAEIRNLKNFKRNHFVIPNFKFLFRGYGNNHKAVVLRAKAVAQVPNYLQNTGIILIYTNTAY